MRLALAQARRASGRTFPNPPVGAVVVRGDRVLGRGFTRPAGGPHAEVVALDAAAERFGARALRGATLAVTLEPCCHLGRTGPCTQAVIEAGIARVWIGHEDPNPRVGGRGARTLRAAGLELRTGVLEQACREQHRGFLSVHERGRPFVSLKIAASLDGRIATGSGESRWITGERARALVHTLRGRADAIVIGSGAALADDPELTARHRGKVVHRPVRVLIDSRLEAPATLRLYRDGFADRTWVLCGARAPQERRRTVAATGARLFEVRTSGGHLRLKEALARLAREGLTDVLVEGGGQLAAALLREELVDEVHWFVAPRMLGEEGRAALGPLGLRRLGESPCLESARVRVLAEAENASGRVAPAKDVYIYGRLGARGGESA
jgi:diaminohydroxyphosphoribosylaminopyrimidine deaminase / 5-amino-6-(5-phosphoribosylamino)uracil reductase